MHIDNATDLLSALANPHRLEIFRALARCAPAGMAAGDIASLIGVAPSALSFHLNHLERVNLIKPTREGRSILYALEAERMRALLAFLTDDCCGGRPELCGARVATKAPCY